MHKIGILIVIAGMTAVPSVLLLDSLNRLPVALALHVTLFVAIAGLWIKGKGSFGRWLAHRDEVEYSVHPFIAVLLGILFAAPGLVFLMFWRDIKHGKTPPETTCYGGVVFLLTGLGISIMAVADWIRRRRNK